MTVRMKALMNFHGRHEYHARGSEFEASESDAAYYEGLTRPLAKRVKADAAPEEKAAEYETKVMEPKAAKQAAPRKSRTKPKGQAK